MTELGNILMAKLHSWIISTEYLSDSERAGGGWEGGDVGVTVGMVVNHTSHGQLGTDDLYNDLKSLWIKQALERKRSLSCEGKFWQPKVVIMLRLTITT